MNNLVSLSPYAATINRSFGPGMDFISSAISTVCCSVVSTPQMMICDNIMAGTYGNLVEATKGLMKDKGVKGFYGGWWPGIAGKIPSYVSGRVDLFAGIHNLLTANLESRGLHGLYLNKLNVFDPLYTPTHQQKTLKIP